MSQVIAIATLTDSNAWPVSCDGHVLNPPTWESNMRQFFARRGKGIETESTATDLRSIRPMPMSCRRLLRRSEFTIRERQCTVVQPI